MMRTPETWTGERLETFVTGDTKQEHLHRYAIAIDMAKGKKLLDIACGEGYGAMLLAKQAVHVTAVDIDDATIKRAQSKYQTGNISFKQGSIFTIDAADGSFDMITCFETLEHLDDHDKALSELKRVLIPGGILLISTPDKSNYSDKTGYKNPFHKKELYKNEFKELLESFFSHVDFYNQFSFSGSIILKETPEPLSKIYSGDFNTVSADSPREAMYWVAIASDKENELPSSGLFNCGNTITGIQDEQTALVKKTLTYRTGHVLLAPFKFIGSLFRK